MRKPENRVYEFGPFRLDTRERLLFRGVNVEPLEPLVYQTLAALVESSGHTLRKAELMEALWPDTFVAETSLARNISLLRKALGKTRYIETVPKLGYRFVADVRLREPAAGASIAVLPFANMGRRAGTEFFSDGLTEELIHALTKIRELRVVARTSSFQFKGKAHDVRRIGEQLGATALLEGSVRNTGQRLRVTAQLINTADGCHLWSEVYERELADVFRVQDEIAQAIASTLKLRFSGTADAAPQARHEVDSETYRLYLKGRYFRNKVTVEGFQKSVGYYERAIARDPRYAAAFAGLAESYCNLGWNYSVMAPEEAYRKATVAVRQALDFDSTLSDAYVSLGLVKLNYEWDWPGTEAAFRRAIELNPSDANAHHRYSHYLIAMDRVAESLTESLAALDLDPLDPVMNQHLGWHYRLAREYEAAVAQHLRTLEMHPESEMTHIYLGQALLKRGEMEEAITAFRRAVALGRRKPGDLVWLGHAYAVSGARREARKVLHQLREEMKRSYVSPYSLALIHTGLDEKDQAFEWLSRAYEERNTLMAYLKVEPDFDGLRSDARFARLLERMGLDHTPKADKNVIA